MNLCFKIDTRNNAKGDELVLSRYDNSQMVAFSRQIASFNPPLGTHKHRIVLHMLVNEPYPVRCIMNDIPVYR